jgi:hypothetical protein
MKYIERIVVAFHPDGSIRGAAQEQLSTDPSGEFPDKRHAAEPLDVVVVAALIPGREELLAQISALQKENETQALIIESIKRHLPREAAPAPSPKPSH